MKRKNKITLEAFKALADSRTEGLKDYKDLVVMRAIRDRVEDGRDYLPLEVLVKRAEALATARYWSQRRRAE